MKWNNSLVWIFTIIIHVHSQFIINPISLLQLFADLEFSELETTIYHYKNVGEEKFYNKYECYNQLKFLKDGLQNREIWALKSLYQNLIKINLNKNTLLFF